MAYITPVSGGSQPVFATDVLNPVPVGTQTAATPVNFQGPKLDFFFLTANTSVAAQQDVNEYVELVLQGIQQVATVAMYQVDGVQISVATYPTGAFANVAANTNLDTSVVLSYANVTYAGFSLSSCTTNGFKLV